jgi:pimeloyl-ACP methyl ester carboxylesterase
MLRRGAAVDTQRLPCRFVRSEPVLLVHGWGGSFESTWRSAGWDALLEDAGRTVIGVDLLGHGAAPKPHEPEAYLDLTERVVDVLRDVGAVDAVGFSLGAMTLLTLASRQPERFGRLVLGGVGENVLRTDEEAQRRIVAAVEGGGDSSDVTSALFGQYARQPGNDAAALAACMKAPRRRLTVDDLRGVACPTLVCIGDKDFAGPGEPLVAALPDARLVTLRNVDHFATTEAFAFIDAALEFLEAVPA